MKTWLRSVLGIAAGGLNLFANGTNWKQVALSTAIAGIGVVSHMTSTSNLQSVVAVNRGAIPPTVTEKF
jgi:hypothetical protein